MQFLEEWDTDLRSGDPLRFPGYAESLEQEPESTRTGLSSVGGRTVVLIDTDFGRFGGTMGTSAGEKIVRAFDRATLSGLPVVATISSGGARLQEGMLSLVQMGRTAAARQRHAAAGLLMVAVYRSPTTGGVFASWGSLADVRAAVAGATVGFAGPRVVETVTGSRPPASSHTAESALAAGLVDAVIPLEQHDLWVRSVLGDSSSPLDRLSGRPAVPGLPTVGEADSGWAAVCTARDPMRPSGIEWAAALTSSWTDLASTDPAIRAGLATMGGRRVMVVAMDRYARGDAASRPGPSAFRTAQRAIALAGQLSLPLLTLIDTPGAEPGPEAEADGIAGEIARTVAALATAPVVTVSLCVGEGGSGGAMALGYTDRAYMLEGAVFSVIGPEAAGAILARDSGRAPEMADLLGLTGAELVALGVVDDILPVSGADAVAEVRLRILEAMHQARVGDREVRSMQASHRHLEERTIDPIVATAL